MKNVLVTGGAGFIAHMVIDTILETTDWNIITIERVEYTNKLNRLQDVISSNPDKKHRVKCVYHDLNFEFDENISKEIGEDIHYILHIAAASHVDKSIVNPLSCVMDNVVGTCNILNFARKCSNLERFVYFSSHEVFGSAPIGVEYNERDRYNSSNPYAASKAAGEELAVAYFNTYKLPVYIMHVVNVYGHRQYPDKYFIKCIKSILHDEEIVVHADPITQKPGSRLYVHVKDVADSLMFILNLSDNIIESDFGGAKCPKFNIMGYQEFDNLEIAKIIAKCMDKELKYKIVDINSIRPGLDSRYSLSGDLMKTLGWQPKLTFEERIQELVDWTLMNKQWI
jgi:dTDP-glucose 4,6-dehydratase